MKKKTSLVALPFAIGLIIASPGAAQADPGPGNFGQHVSARAQTMELGADMNPGVHQGASGQHEMTCTAYHCNIANHEDLGMTGILEVVR